MEDPNVKYQPLEDAEQEMRGSNFDFVEGVSETFAPPNYSNSGISNIRVSVDDSAIDNYRDNHSESYPTLRRVSSQSSRFSAKSFDDSYYGDVRMQKIAQAEAVIRKEMFKDCTFRPKIKSLPTAYGPLKENGTPFVTRVFKWQKEKEMDLQNKMQISIKNLEDQCSFRPQINKNSVIAMKEIRGDSPETANERLFKSHLTIADQHQKLIRDIIEKEERQILQECTFRPQLVTKGKSPFDHVPSKVHREIDNNSRFGKQLERNREERKAIISKECTFTPKVNSIRSSMISAKAYISIDVVDRLTRPATAIDESRSSRNSQKDDPLLQAFDESFEPDFRKPAVIDAASYIGALQSGIRRSSTDPQSPRGKNRTSFGHSEEDTISVNSVNRTNSRKPTTTPKQFENFLERQKLVLKKREENVKHVERSITPNFKPQISRKSASVLNEKKAPDFMTRLDRDIKRRSSLDQQSEILQQQQAECSFQPKINKRAELLRSRSSFEMSYGDQLRHDTKLKMLKLQTENAELVGATFQPRISNKAKELARSKLQLSDDPSLFLEWVQEKKKTQENHREMELRKREEDELKDCTFKPNTTECPAYIKRIAESISKMKSARGNTVIRANAKPDWR